MTDGFQPLYPVGLAAQRAGLTPRQLRYYERLDLLHPARRGTRRLYSDADIARLVEIRRLHRTGTRLEAIRQALAAFEAGETAAPVDDRPAPTAHDEDNDVRASALGRRPPPSLYPLRDRRAIEERIDRYERDAAPVPAPRSTEKEWSE